MPRYPPASSCHSPTRPTTLAFNAHPLRFPITPYPSVYCRYNNTKQFELQVRSKVPPAFHTRKLKQTVATSRPLAGGASKAPAAAAAAAGPSQQPRRQQSRQVPDTPDSRGKALRAANEAEARMAAQQQRQPGQQAVPGQHSVLPDDVVVSPDDRLQQLLPPGQAAVAAAGLDAIPDTDARPGLMPPPAALAGAGGGRMARTPSMRLDFGEPCSAFLLR